jgi:hypothetical protein
LIVVDHFVGSVPTAEIARPDGPRNCGHVESGGAGAARTDVVMNNTRARGADTRESTRHALALLRGRAG